ncbi:hypothetical protein H5410_015792 [Solanum commersonii]|uniref:Uncharacterized protein n=1 Tax=Solanum commersonii TaxID=4109 RepID=A0A9J5ZUT8_SOLCO|nr:hypothetical protein H5410_015792 [Solanum commersonii]
MENSVEKKATTINRFIDTTVNVGRKEILDGFRARSCVVIKKEDVAATRSNATTSLTHGFIISLHRCLLASSKPLPVMSLTPFAKCVNHGTWTVIWIHHPPETPLSSSIMSISVTSVRIRSKIGMLTLASSIMSKSVSSVGTRSKIRTLTLASSNIPMPMLTFRF